ncbi:MAG TPA: MinD/ParA family protein [Firmicutes bacterium]|nr:MinD/ParA family protein [Bacillota bacterium]
MNDQAGSLRQMVESESRKGRLGPRDLATGIINASCQGQGSTPSTAHDHGGVLAITSGKGGVGKTNLAVNLAISLSSLGHRVTLLDADIGLGNVDTLLGISTQWGLGHVLSGEKLLGEVILDGPEGIKIIPGGAGLGHFARRHDLLSNVPDLMAGYGDDCDLLIVDTGAGLTDNVVSFLKAADRVLVVTTPEPTAITDAYATIKVTGQENPRARIDIIVNMTSGEAEARAVVAKLNMVAVRFLGIHVRDTGYIVRDPAVGRAVLAQKPFVLAYPGAPASRCVRAVAGRISAEFETQVPVGGGTGRSRVRQSAPTGQDISRAMPRHGGGFGRLLRRLFAS